MNLTEARATQDLLDWLTSLVAFEVHPDCGVDGASLLDAVDILATRAYKALGAGATPGRVRSELVHILGGEGVLPRQRDEDVDDIPPNAGSST